MIVTRLHIKDGKVINISVGDTDKPWMPAVGVEVVEVERGKESVEQVIGATYLDGVFKAPAVSASVPEPSLQAQIDALNLEVSKLKTDVSQLKPGKP